MCIEYSTQQASQSNTVRNKHHNRASYGREEIGLQFAWPNHLPINDVAYNMAATQLAQHGTTFM